MTMPKKAGIVRKAKHAASRKRRGVTVETKVREAVREAKGETQEESK